MQLGSADVERWINVARRHLFGDLRTGVKHLSLSLIGGMNNPTAMKIKNTAFTLTKLLTTFGMTPTAQSQYAPSAKSKEIGGEDADTIGNKVKSFQLSKYI